MNALPIEISDSTFPFETYVRGKTIKFDKEAINKYLGNSMPLHDPKELCAFHIRQNRGNWDHAEIQRDSKTVKEI